MGARESEFIFCYINDDANGIYRDMTSEKAEGIISFLPSHRMSRNKILHILERALLSSKMQRTPLAATFQGLCANLDNYPYEDIKDYYLLMPSTSVGKMSLRYLESFRKRHPNVKLFPVLTDSMHASSPHMEYVRPKLSSPVWEKVLTFDKNDASEFGFTWFGYCWYSNFENVKPRTDSCDIFYVGFKKGKRENLIASVYEAACAHGITSDFRIVSSKEGPVRTGSKLNYATRRFAYPELVSYIKSANCVLEVLQEGQDTQTIKYYEAVVYGKKLLTNNRHVAELPYYNNRRMRYFETTEDIDWDWVGLHEDLKYDYKDEFSPLKIVDFVKTLYGIE